MRKRKQKEAESAPIAVLSRSVTAQYLGGLSPRQVDRMIRAGQLSASKLGRRVVVSKASCDRLLAGTQIPSREPDAA